MCIAQHICKMHKMSNILSFVVVVRDQKAKKIKYIAWSSVFFHNYDLSEVVEQNRCKCDDLTLCVPAALALIDVL